MRNMPGNCKLALVLLLLSHGWSPRVFTNGFALVPHQQQEKRQRQLFDIQQQYHSSRRPINRRTTPQHEEMAVSYLLHMTSSSSADDENTTMTSSSSYASTSSDATAATANTTTTSPDTISIKGDPLRAKSGIRPSLHPTTINAIAEALKIRAMNKPDMPLRIGATFVVVVQEDNKSNNDNDADNEMEATTATNTTTTTRTVVVQALDVALTAGKIASTAIGKRQAASKQDGMIFTPDEEQAIAGRVVGVVMRLEALEQVLNEKVAAVPWIAKFHEWNTFGVLPHEKDVKEKENKEEQGSGGGAAPTTTTVAAAAAVDRKIKEDPLFAMNRAESVLALFLQTVEIPQLAKAKQTVSDGSKIDFLDEDRSEVLLS
jgi:hypothetical protein